MLLVWDGRPLKGFGGVLAVIEGDISGSVLQELAAAESAQEFFAILARLEDSQPGRLAGVAGSPSTFHLGFFRDAVQVSFGERGFVPLSRLLDYSERELLFYMSQHKRIDLPLSWPDEAFQSNVVH